jgi:hypothetical protein
MNSTEDLIFQSLSVCAGTLNQISVNIESPHKIADKKNYKFYLITKTESVVFQQRKIHQTVFQHITVKQYINKN